MLSQYTRVWLFGALEIEYEISPTLTEELCSSGGNGVAKILSQSQVGAVSFKRQRAIPEPKSAVEL